MSSCWVNCDIDSLQSQCDTKKAQNKFDVSFTFMSLVEYSQEVTKVTALAHSDKGSEVRRISLWPRRNSEY